MFLNSLCALVESQILYKTEVNNQSRLLNSVYLLALKAYLIVYSGGAKRSRTVDLLRARQALYQLSYGPM